MYYSPFNLIPSDKKPANIQLSNGGNPMPFFGDFAPLDMPSVKLSNTTSVLPSVPAYISVFERNNLQRG